jgi:hypothetical protein
MFVDLWELAMLSPQQIATINAEIAKLEYARKQSLDSGIQKVIEGWITGEKMKLNSGILQNRRILPIRRASLSSLRSSKRKPA